MKRIVLNKSYTFPPVGVLSPTPECILGPSVGNFLKARNRNRFGGLIAVFNCFGRSDWQAGKYVEIDGRERVFTETTTIKPNMLGEWIETESGEATQQLWSVWDAKKRSLHILENASDTLEIDFDEFEMLNHESSLTGLKSNCYSISRVILGQLAVVGFADLYNPLGPIEQVSIGNNNSSACVNVQAEAVGDFFFGIKKEIKLTRLLENDKEVTDRVKIVEGTERNEYIILKVAKLNAKHTVYEFFA